MAKLNVFLKTDYRNKNNEYPVLIEYSHLSTRFRINPGIKITQEETEIYFDTDADLFKIRSKHKLGQSKKELIRKFNDKLQEIQSRLETIILDQKQKNENLTACLIKSKYFGQSSITLRQHKRNQTVLEWYKEFLSVKKNKIKAGLKSYNSTYTHLSDLIGSDSVMLSDLRLDFFEQFLLHLEKKKLKGTTIHKQFKNLRIMLNWIKMIDEDDLIKIPNTYKTFEVRANYAMPIGLSKDEFDEFLKIDLTERPELKRTRDLFAFGVAMGGLRHSDLKEMGAHIQKFGKVNGRVTFFENKTGNQHSDIPLNNLASQILSEFSRFPHVPTSQRMNKNLQEIAKLLTWDRVITIPDYDARGKICKKNYIKLKDILSTKFMRKTSATIDGLLNIEPIISMHRSGHKSMSSYLRYRVIDEDSFDISNSRWNEAFSNLNYNTNKLQEN